MLYDVLHKRKVCVDAILEGLEVFKLKSAIATFPEIFKHLFVMKGCTPNDIIGCLHFSNTLEGKEKEIEELIKKTIKNMSTSGTILIAAMLLYDLKLQYSLQFAQWTVTY